MNRMDAHKYCRTELDKHNLSDWKIRLTTDPNTPFLGLCSYKDKCIILNAFHIDTHPDAEIVDTILHEIAHALCPNQGHNDVWALKAREIGCTNVQACSHLNIPEHILDAIRSGADVEITVEEKVITNVIRTPKYSVSRLQDKCPDCGKVAKEKFAIETVDKEGNQVKLITLECFHIIKKIIPKATPFEFMVSNDWKDEVKNCKHEWNKNQCIKCEQFKLFDFQVKGARAAEAGLALQKGFCIFDDMGLGKTVQGLALPKFHPEYLPFLVVTKSAITFQWLKNIHWWLGPNYFPQIIRTSRDVILPELKAYIIPYDLLRRMNPEKMQKAGFKLIILDECQQIKNVDSARTQEVRKLVKNPEVKVIPLSATPWKNRGNELFPVLNMVDPTKFYSNQAFLDTWVEFYWEGNKRKMGGIRNIPKFKELTKNLIVRREFDEVMEEFPSVNRMKLPVQLDELSQNAYDDSESDFVAWYNDKVIGGEEDKISGIEILAELQRARHIAGLGKIPATLGFVEEFVEDTDRKLVIFVHFKDVGQLIHNALSNTSKETNPDWYHLAQEIEAEGITLLKYGSEHTGKPAGFDIQKRFNESKRVIMIASTLACGEGIDLQTCADSLLHDRQWNPQNEDQATPGRFKRIGQKEKVINITVPEAEGTVDEYLDMTIEIKRARFGKVHDTIENKGPVWNENSFAKDLAQLIVKKHQEKMKSKGVVKKTNITKAAKFTPKSLATEVMEM